MVDPQRAADEHAIIMLANAYSHAVMRCDGALCAAVYAEDGELIAFGRPPIVGHAALAAAFTATFSPLSFITQTCAAAVVEVSGDNATARFSVNETFQPKGQDGVVMTCIGMYEDKLVRTPAGWRFKQRIFTPFYRGTLAAPGKLYGRPEFAAAPEVWPPRSTGD